MTLAEILKDHEQNISSVELSVASHCKHLESCIRNHMKVYEILRLSVKTVWTSD